MAGKADKRANSKTILYLLIAAALIPSILISLFVVLYAGVFMALAAELLALLGLAISVYVLAYKLGVAPMVCPEGKTINCKLVLDSRYSVWFGMPSAYYGVLFFYIYLLLMGTANYFLAMLLGVVGIAFVAERIRAQGEIGRICLYCNATHIITICLLIISVALVL